MARDTDNDTQCCPDGLMLNNNKLLDMCFEIIILYNTHNKSDNVIGTYGSVSKTE